MALLVDFAIDISQGIQKLLTLPYSIIAHVMTCVKAFDFFQCRFQVKLFVLIGFFAASEKIVEIIIDFLVLVGDEIQESTPGSAKTQCYIQLKSE